MKRALVLLVVLATFAPTAHAREVPPYPEVLTRLLPTFIAESEARGKASEGQPWYPQAAEFLQKAKDAQKAGRLRVALFQLETYEELVVAHRLNDSTANLGSTGERKSRIVAATQAHLDEAEDRWKRFRAALHAYDGQIQSVHTAENSIYVADLALTSIVTTKPHATLAKEFPKQPEVELGYIHALVRSSYIPALNVGWALRMIEEIGAAGSEGLPPLVDKANLTGLTREALSISFENAPGLPPLIAEYEERLEPARANREGLLALAGAIAEKRADRLSQMQTQFGDARARRNVVEDADRFMGRHLNNTTVDNATAHGMTAVFLVDAIDRGLYAREIIASGRGDLSVPLVAWSNIDAAKYAEEVLVQISPVKPSPTPVAPTPGVGLAALAAVLIAVALLRSTGRKRSP